MYLRNSSSSISKLPCIQWLLPPKDDSSFIDKPNNILYHCSLITLSLDLTISKAARKDSHAFSSYDWFRVE